MKNIEWNESFNIGIQQIDLQHKNLVKMLNQIYDAINSGKDRDLIPKTLMEMINYNIIHFGTEERLMEQYNYPEYKAHKKEHESFLEEVKKFTAELQKGNLDIAKIVASFLYEWLSTHIQGTDKKYGPFLKEKGVK